MNNSNLEITSKAVHVCDPDYELGQAAFTAWERTVEYAGGVPPIGWRYRTDRDKQAWQAAAVAAVMHEPGQ
jgi:hypothetical protein